MSYIEIVPAKEHVVVRWRGQTVVDTTNALELREGSYPPVLYVPRADANMSLLERSQHHTTCPHKGSASYFHLRSETSGDDNAVWTYETPKAGVEAIAGYLAFYPNKVEITRQAA